MNRNWIQKKKRYAKAVSRHLNGEKKKEDGDS